MHGQLILWTDWLRIPKHIKQLSFSWSLTFTDLHYKEVVKNAYSSASQMPDYLLVIWMGEMLGLEEKVIAVANVFLDS